MASSHRAGNRQRDPLCLPRIKGAHYPNFKRAHYADPGTLDMLAFSAVLALIIGIGTGAVTTLFGAMNASVLRPLPVWDRLASWRSKTRDAGWSRASG